MTYFGHVTKAALQVVSSFDCNRQERIATKKGYELVLFGGVRVLPTDEKATNCTIDSFS